jgi:hypothetical protein
MNPRTGSAMPMVLFGMALAILVATVGWSRSWSRRTTSAHMSLAWQSRLLAESATACALHDAIARQMQPTRDSTATDTTRKRKTISVRDTSDSSCGFHGPVDGSMEWSAPAGTQLLFVRARGEVTESGKSLPTEMSSTWGGAPPPDPFSPALSLWDRNAGTPQLRGKIRGAVRLRVDGPAPVGFVAQPSGGISQFVPSSLGSDTVAAFARMAAAFRSEAAHLGGDRFSRTQPPPQDDSLVYTVGDVVFDGPWTGAPWSPSGKRTLFVEGRVEFRGKIRLDGWRIYAKGPVVVQDEASILSTDIFSAGGVQIADRSTVSGQILSRGSILVSGRGALASPSFAAIWPGKGADTIPRFAMSDRSSAQAYLVVLGGGAEVSLGPGVDFRGVAVCGGLLRVEGTLHGVGVAGRVDCGQIGVNCSAGNFDRPSLPTDFAFPLGLPGNLGLRLISWETSK